MTSFRPYFDFQGVLGRNISTLFRPFRPPNCSILVSCIRIAPDDYYHQTFQVKKVFGMNTSMYGYNAHADKPRKSSRKCSECGKSGHTKSSCPKKKKGKAKKKTNYIENDSSSESSSSDSSFSDDSNSDSHICYGLKKKRTHLARKRQI